MYALKMQVSWISHPAPYPRPALQAPADSSSAWSRDMFKRNKKLRLFLTSLFFFFLFPLSRGRLHVPEGSCWGFLPHSCSRDGGKHTLGSSLYPSGRITCIFHPGTGGPVLSQIHASVSKQSLKSHTKVYTQVATQHFKSRIAL